MISTVADLAISSSVAQSNSASLRQGWKRGCLSNDVVMVFVFCIKKSHLVSYNATDEIKYLLWPSLSEELMFKAQYLFHRLNEQRPKYYTKLQSFYSYRRP